MNLPNDFKHQKAIQKNRKTLNKNNKQKGQNNLQLELFSE